MAIQLTRILFCRIVGFLYRSSLVFLVCVAWHCPAFCQENAVILTGPDGSPANVVVPAGVQISGVPVSGAVPVDDANSAVPAQPPADGEAGGGTPPGGPPGVKAPDAKPESKPLQRGDVLIDKGDPKELSVKPDDDGLIAFSFRNQPWPALVQWLAEISSAPLDWQELPSDTVNLASSGRYSLAETRDLFNRHLLFRGYVLLDLDGGMTVVKTANINPAVVPRVNPNQLSTLQPHSFVRTSFDCGWLLAPKMAEELKPLISSNGRLIALEKTNRLEAMDAAINLQQIYQLLQEEMSQESQIELAREFEIRHIPAEDAKTMLSAFLGIEKKESQAPVSPEQMQQMQQMQMMQQQMQANGGGSPAAASQGASNISIVINSRRNSLLVNAPPDRMAIAAQFVKQIDVPSGGLQSLADVQTRVQVFRLSSLDPNKLAEIANDMNVLEPSTRLRVDEKNKALIVAGSAADRFVIQSLIEKLDGSARKFEVLQLRRLDAQEVAESIMFLMGTADTKKESNNRRFMYSFWDDGSQNKNENEDQFRVAANVRYRQVLLWANQYEMEEVRNLLVKLGEMPPEGGSARTVRLIEATSSPETYEYLKSLQQRFQGTMPNEIQLPGKEEFVDPILPPNGEAQEANGLSIDDAAMIGDDGSDVNGESSLVAYTLTQEPSQDRPVTSAQDPPPIIRSSEEFERVFGGRPNAADAPQKGQGAPVKIELDSDGNLVLSSDDTRALDRLESMMLDMAPPKRPYSVFHIEHASATWMMLNLTDYFKEDDKSEQDDPFMRFIFDLDSNEKEGPSGLGKAKPLRFVADNDTGSIVVTGASSGQLKTIGELISLWDVPEPINKRQSRFTRLVPVKYSRAERIAETIKDAYRDLLSSNDKAFSQGNQGGGGAVGASTDRAQPRSRDGGGSGLVDSQGGKTSGDTNMTFKGKLSIGVDNVSNALLISAEGEELLDLVCDMIDQLDSSATVQGNMQIRGLKGNVSVRSLETALQLFSPSGSKPSSPVISAGNAGKAEPDASSQKAPVVELGESG